MKTVRVRVAPSPTGDPHVGTAYIGLFDYVFARSQNGKFILRIEDTDRTRSTPESEQAIMESLLWVGLQWDEGPDIGGDYGPYRQSERSEIYRAHTQMLLEADKAYRCFCTPERLTEMRDRQRKEKLPPKYDGRCRELKPEEIESDLSEGKPFVVRLRIPPHGHVSFTDKTRGLVQIATEQIDDQVLLKSDGFPTYHLANVVDDHLMEITHVIRAEEWISSTPKHVLLYEAFGWEMPQFIHMPLLRNTDKSKISKRKNPVSLLWYKDQGYMPEALLNFLGNMGWSFSDGREIFSLDEMIADFSWDRVGTTGPVFDITKLDWMNGMYVRQLSPEKLTNRLLETALAGRDIGRERLLRIAPLIQERITKFSAEEFDAMSDFFFIGADQLEYDPGLLVPKKTEPADVAPALQKMRERFDALDAWETQPMEDAIRALADEIGWKAGSLFMCVRIAVTGRKATPPLLESMVILGKDESLKRMDNAIEKAQALL
jgi:glutamyl-tRNA synthetase